MHRLGHFALAAVIALAACGKAETPATAPARDPAVAQALGDPLMIDPDLSQRNEGAAALTVASDTRLPELPASPEAVAAARAEAARMVGGPDKLAGPPAPVAEAAPLPARWSARGQLTALGIDRACLSELEPGAAWAARLPEALPIFPRGATMAAAGRDRTGCRARAARFTTPVPASEVLAFYWTRAKAGRLAPRHLSAGQSHVLKGGQGTLRFDLRVREADGQTIVDLAAFSR